jgi:hypothetical protein
MAATKGTGDKDRRRYERQFIFVHAAAAEDLPRQQCLYFLPLPQGQSSLRPILGSGRR